MKTLLTLSLIGFLIGCFYQSCSSSSKKINLHIDFTEVTNRQPALDSFYTQAVASVDINNDYFPELYLTNSWTGNNNHFYRNSNGVFEKDSNSFYLNYKTISNGCAFADLDNNGYIDLCFSNGDSMPNVVFFGYEQYKFKGQDLDSTFKGRSYGTAIADINNDGTLEVYISNYDLQQNKLYTIQNKHFINLDSTNLTTDSSSTLFSTWSDLNNDGLQDLIMCNTKANFMYKNDGDFQFNKVENSYTNTKGESYGVSVADFNNDGLMDFFVANWRGKNHLYKNNGDFKFHKLADTLFYNEKSNSEGSCWGDYDNDGFVDLFVTNDGKNILYKNINGTSFKIQDSIPLTDTSVNSNGVIWADYDLDGDLDIIIANGGNQRNQLFNNSGNDNNWIKIKLKGTISNRSAIGAKVIVYSGNLTQYQEIQSQSGGGCGSQKPLLLHFGLAQNTQIDSVQLLWPSSPMTTKYNLSANKIYTFIE